MRNLILKNVADYSSDRISLDEITIDNYITTDNLLQNKKGKTTANKTPKQQSNTVTKFEKDDILIGNIRPYLKKIWLAKHKGGSSSDVLTFRVKKNIDSTFIYYSLFRDDFFEHMMNGAKGTKMPRGDKNQILNFPIRLPNLPTQKAIAKVLSDLDAKIELNNKINQELEAMAKTLYDYWFVQFDFPCLPSDYRPSGQVNPNIDLAQKIKSVCTYRQTGGLPLPDGKKWFVYVILCQDGTFYKGITNDLYRRYYEHKTGQGAEWTKVHIPKKIIHYEEFETQQQAAKREKELKTGFGRTWLKREYDKFLKYGYPSKNGLPAHQTHLMMAGKMVFNEGLKREIPEGWEVKCLADCIKIFDSIRVPLSRGEREKNEGSIPYYGATSVMGYVNDFIFDDEYILLAEDGSVMDKNGNPIVQFIWGKTWVNNHAHVIQAENKLHNEFIFQLVKMIHVVLIKTGSIQMKINQENLKKHKVLIPTTELMDKFSIKAISIRKQLINNIEQNQQLTELRDWLLPMLMNGQVVVDN